jgi:flagellar hook-associated protein 1 FlgK
MSLTGLLNIGKSALSVSQTQLAVTSHNIANVQTPGYCRQEVIVETSSWTTASGGPMVGQGVTVKTIKRHYDALLQQELFLTQQDYGKYTLLNQTLSGVEQLFNEAQELGLARSLTDFFNAWQDVANHPEGLTERYLLLKKAEALTATAQKLEQGLNDILKNIEKGISESAEQINTLAAQIARINGQIMRSGTQEGTLSANNLRDQREALLAELSQLADISIFEDPANGAVHVTLGMRTLVDGDTSRSLTAEIDETGRQTLVLNGEDITSRIAGGKLGGLLTARKEIEETVLTGLRRFVAALINAVNLQHREGYGLDGSTGNDFFSPLQLTVRDYSSGADLTAEITDYSQLTMEEYTVRFSGGNYYVYERTTGELKTSGVYEPSGTTINLEGMRWEISGTVSDQDSFQVSPLTTAVAGFQTALTSAQQIAAAGSSSGVPGDNENALALADLIHQGLTVLDNQSLEDHYQYLVAQVGLKTQEASEALTFTENFLNHLNDRRDSVSGVSLDEEATNLIRFQRAYQAAARLIRATDELFQTLLNL